jgi:hypothetical protein
MELPKVRKTFLIMLGATILLAASMAMLKFTALCTLQEVNVNQEKYMNCALALESSSEQKLFDIPINEIADRILENDKIKYVELDYNLPSGIDISVNDVKPIACVLTENGYSLYKTDKNGMIFPDDSDEIKLNCPIITGIYGIKAYHRIKDYRFLVVLEKLEMIQDDYPDYYLAISTIDLSGDDYISVSLDGLPFEIITYAGSLDQSMKKLNAFLFDYNLDLNGIRKLDMRSNELIVAAE